MYTFQIKEKDWSKILSALHILIALIFLFDLSQSQKAGRKDWIFSAVYFIAAMFLIAAGAFNKRILTRLSKHLALLWFEFMLILGGAIYYWSKGASVVAVSHALLAGVLVLVWIYLRRKENGEQIIVSEANILLPALTGDRIVHWGQLTSVIKKHDLLTIDFRNNKLLQVQITNPEDINEDEFNEFCARQLQKREGL